MSRTHAGTNRVNALPNFERNEVWKWKGPDLRGEGRGPITLLVAAKHRRVAGLIDRERSSPRWAETLAGSVAGRVAPGDRARPAGRRVTLANGQGELQRAAKTETPSARFTASA